MKHRLWILGLLIGALVFTSACGMVNTLLGGRSAGTVRELWDDVPRMDGLKKVDMEMPLAATLALRAVSQGRMNFIAFTTAASAQEVQDFYTVERMNSAGWNSSETAGCVGDAETAEAGAFCFFGKESGNKSEVLAIVAARDEDTGGTAVFFARIDTTAEEDAAQ